MKFCIWTKNFELFLTRSLLSELLDGFVGQKTSFEEFLGLACSTRWRHQAFPQGSNRWAVGGPRQRADNWLARNRFGPVFGEKLESVFGQLAVDRFSGGIRTGAGRFREAFLNGRNVERLRTGPVVEAGLRPVVVLCQVRLPQRSQIRATRALCHSLKFRLKSYRKKVKQIGLYHRVGGSTGPG